MTDLSSLHSHSYTAPPRFSGPGRCLCRPLFHGVKVSSCPGSLARTFTESCMEPMSSTSTFSSSRTSNSSGSDLPSQVSAWNEVLNLPTTTRLGTFSEAFGDGTAPWRPLRHATFDDAGVHPPFVGVARVRDGRLPRMSHWKS